MTPRTLATCAFQLFVAGTAVAAPCANDDFELHVTGVRECIVMRHYGGIAGASPEAMVVYLHGDVSTGGPADYQFRTAERQASTKIVAIALVRPGYPDGEGNESSGNSNGRRDHYTKENIAEIGGAIEHLRAHFKPKKVILVGHSGGAAIAAVLLGSMPKLADGAVLVSCPCDVVTWRAGRRAWSRSESPLAWADKVQPSIAVAALTGTRDDNTSPQLAEAYVAALKKGGVEASFSTVPNATHNSAFDSPMVAEAIERLVAR